MLTTDTLPRAILGTTLNEKKHFRRLPNVELIKGKSIVVNASGSIYLYMGDDHRKDNPIQIIVNDFCGNLAFLPIECKCAIELVCENDSYIIKK